MNPTAIELVKDYCHEAPALGRIESEGVRFTAPDEPPEGTYIPFEVLGYNTERGFSDVRTFPAERSV